MNPFGNEVPSHPATAICVSALYQASSGPAPGTCHGINGLREGGVKCIAAYVVTREAYVVAASPYVALLSRHFDAL